MAEHPYTFPLDDFQTRAINAIGREENVLVTAKTGSGKTLVGEYQIWHSLKKGKRVFYTTPIKSLSNQKFHDLKQMYPSVGIMTGDIKFAPQSDIVVLTTEILRNLLYKQGSSTESLGITASLSLDDVDAIVVKCGKSASFSYLLPFDLCCSPQPSTTLNPFRNGLLNSKVFQ